MPGMFDICKLSLDLQVEVSFRVEQKSLMLWMWVNGCGLFLWVVDRPTQGLVKGFAKYMMSWVTTCTYTCIIY